MKNTSYINSVDCTTLKLIPTLSCQGNTTLKLNPTLHILAKLHDPKSKFASLRAKKIFYVLGINKQKYHCATSTRLTHHKITKELKAPLEPSQFA